MAHTREPEAGRGPVLDVPVGVPVNRREFLSLGLGGIVGLSLLSAPGCAGREPGKKGKKGDGGGGGGGY